MRRLTFLLNFVCLSCYNLNFQPQLSQNKLLLVSFDGFRHDYIDKFDMKNFKKLHSQGLRTRWTIDQFVTKTFPNHWTLATGLYEESHGIISNHFWDPKLQKEFFAFGRPAYKFAWDPKFWGGDPIWRTNERQGGKSGSFYWVGSEVPVMRPTFWEKYNVSYPWNDRVDKVVSWFEEEGINFGTLYIDEPDHSGHQYGPSGMEMAEVLKRVDDLLGYLLKKLPDQINLIVTSDHGMEDVNKDQTVFIEDLVPRQMYDKWFGELTHAGIWANQTQLDKIYKILKEYNSPHLNVWYRHEIPEYFHIKELFDSFGK